MRGIFGLRYDNSAHLIFIEVITDGHLTLIFFITLSHHDAVTTSASLLFDATKNRTKIIMHKLRHDDAYYLHRHHLTMTKGLTDHVRIEIMFTCILLHALPLGSTNPWTVFQRTRYRSNRNAKVASDIFHCYRCLIFHDKLPLVQN